MSRAPRAAVRVGLAVSVVALASAGLTTVGTGTALPAPGPASTGARPTVGKFDPRMTRPRWMPGEVLVRFRDGVGGRSRGALHASLGARVGRRLSRLGVDVVRLPRGLSVTDALARYRRSPLVRVAEPNYLRFPEETIPNDPSFGQQWALRNAAQVHPVSDSLDQLAGTDDADIDASDGWDLQQGSASTVIAVIDSGAQVTHSDLAASLWTNPLEAAGTPGVDDDGNGFIDDLNGWDFGDNDATLLDESNPPLENYDHGTHVAGTVAAAVNDSVGVAGVCPGCRVMVLKFMERVDVDGDGIFDLMAGPIDAEIAAIDYAVANGARIMNFSFGGDEWSALERSAIKAAGQAGVLTVAAAGNDSLDNDMSLEADIDGDGFPDAFSPGYPASYSLPTIISVAASNHHDEYGYSTDCALFLSKWECAFTNWGRQSVDLAAPGVDILSTIPADAYDTWDGTSMAAPHVAGVAGLVLSHNPSYTAVQIRNAVMNSVDLPSNLGTMNSMQFSGARTGSFTRTNGRVNALAALTGDPTTNAHPVTDGNIDGAKLVSSTVKGSVAYPNDVNDVWKKRLLKGVRYRVVLNGPAGRDFDLVVWKPKTLEIWQLEAGCFFGGSGPCKLEAYPGQPDADETVRFRASSTGTYFFLVVAYFSSGKYSLSVDRT